MTAGEINAFDGMFSLIFDALNQQRAASGVRPFGNALQGAAIGRTADIGDVVGKLRGRAKRQRWTTADDEALDRMKEEMELCDTDAALLTWARRSVFVDDLKPGPLYPALLALLMRAFRDRFADPHLALSVFEHARHLSIRSFVFGCTTPAYNELLQTRWAAFRDLRGVRDALDEMRVNGVDCDSHTRALVDGIRREVGERNAWLEDSMSGGEVWEMLREIDRLCAPPSAMREADDTRPPPRRPRRWRPSDDWKARMREGDIDLGSDGLDGWQDTADDLFRE